jgi:histidinol-phosphatase (PHP family)
MIANYHTHTFRCGHASGTEREYIERAIEGGIKIMGFSDHIAYAYPDGHESGFRVGTSKVKDYFDTLKALREEYKDRIEIHIGWESEYLPREFEKMLKNAREWGAEYLILGQHFVNTEYPDGIYTGTPCADEKTLSDYAGNVIDAIGTGVFSYVCHPDVFNFTGDTAVYKKEMRRLCRAAAKAEIPLEINFLGIRDGRHYPRDDFWQVAGEEGCTAVFGFDAHDVPSAFDGASLPEAQRIVRQYGLKLAETVELKKI